MRHDYDVFQNQFIVDDVSKIIKEAIENSIGGTAYQHNKVNQWTSAVVESCLGQLTKLQKPYKYIGECNAYDTKPVRIVLDTEYAL